jgi:hypothetical protein
LELDSSPGHQFFLSYQSIVTLLEPNSRAEEDPKWCADYRGFAPSPDEFPARPSRPSTAMKVMANTRPLAVLVGQMAQAMASGVGSATGAQLGYLTE